MTSLLYGITLLIGALEKAANATSRFLSKGFNTLSTKVLSNLTIQAVKATKQLDDAITFNRDYHSYLIDKAVSDCDKARDRLHAKHTAKLNKFQARGNKMGGKIDKR